MSTKAEGRFHLNAAALQFLDTVYVRATQREQRRRQIIGEPVHPVRNDSLLADWPMSAVKPRQAAASANGESNAYFHDTNFSQLPKEDYAFDPDAPVASSSDEFRDELAHANSLEMEFEFEQMARSSQDAESLADGLVLPGSAQDAARMRRDAGQAVHADGNARQAVYAESDAVKREPGMADEDGHLLQLARDSAHAERNAVNPALGAAEADELSLRVGRDVARAERIAESPAAEADELSLRVERDVARAERIAESPAAEADELSLRVERDVARAERIARSPERGMAEAEELSLRVERDVARAERIARSPERGMAEVKELSLHVGRDVAYSERIAESPTPVATEADELSLHVGRDVARAKRIPMNSARDAAEADELTRVAVQSASSARDKLLLAIAPSLRRRSAVLRDAQDAADEQRRFFGAGSAPRSVPNGVGQTLRSEPFAETPGSRQKQADAVSGRSTINVQHRTDFGDQPPETLHHTTTAYAEGDSLHPALSDTENTNSSKDPDVASEAAALSKPSTSPLSGTALREGRSAIAGSADEAVGSPTGSSLAESGHTVQDRPLSSLYRELQRFTAAQTGSNVPPPSNDRYHSSGSVGFRAEKVLSDEPSWKPSRAQAPEMTFLSERPAWSHFSEEGAAEPNLSNRDSGVPRTFPVSPSHFEAGTFNDGKSATGQSNYAIPGNFPVAAGSAFRGGTLTTMTGFSDEQGAVTIRRPGGIPAFRSLNGMQESGLSQSFAAQGDFTRGASSDSDFTAFPTVPEPDIDLRETLARMLREDAMRHGIRLEG
ncbi:hypothetical protein ACFPVX_22845 [Cohnella faecalis]|uniref:Uncharacterized protein n=1 Tax=Cohnella faecalis TaxID=2315694 RepID=A0A398CSZ5_9BACL|nr:hypothetical protein [Cohnella faecalis]RIE02441.1 hypothetical protein D3H35_17200 [Cohnella faecalis]